MDVCVLGQILVDNVDSAVFGVPGSVLYCGSYAIKATLTASNFSVLGICHT